MQLSVEGGQWQVCELDVKVQVALNKTLALERELLQALSAAVLKHGQSNLAILQADQEQAWAGASI